MANIKSYVLKADGVVLPIPSSYKISYEVLDKDSGRNANGDMVRNILGTKVKIQCVFPMYKEESVFRSLLNVIKNPRLNIEYYDIRADSYLTKTFYPSTPTPEVYTLSDGKLVSQELAINFIEY